MASHAIKNPFPVIDYDGKSVVFTEVIWHSSPVFEGELELPDHSCGPDCKCWKKKQKTRVKVEEPKL